MASEKVNESGCPPGYGPGPSLPEPRERDQPLDLGDPLDFFDRFPYSLVLVDRAGAVLKMNQRAQELFAPGHHIRAEEPRTCCELICRRAAQMDGTCLATRAADAGGPLPEIRIDIERLQTSTAAWVTASPLKHSANQLLFQLRPCSPVDRRRRTAANSRTWSHLSDAPKLQIVTLGKFRVEVEGAPVAGDWVEQRPGQLLKYLICERHRTVSTDQIIEALWPDAGHRRTSGRVRYYVHALRDKLEPDRPKRSSSRFVLAHRGGYTLDHGQVWIDADSFEAETRAGLTALKSHDEQVARTQLEQALRLYDDDFLAECPYEEWTLDERDRLRELAGRALRALVDVERRANRLDAAAVHARRLAQMEPFDTDVQRSFIELCLRRGRQSEAVRRYALLRKRMLREFGQPPAFSLADLREQTKKSASGPSHGLLPR